MQKLVSKLTGLLAIFAALVMTPVFSQSAIAQSAVTMSDCQKTSDQATGQTMDDGAIAHEGHIHRRKKDKSA